MIFTQLDVSFEAFPSLFRLATTQEEEFFAGEARQLDAGECVLELLVQTVELLVAKA